MLPLVGTWRVSHHYPNSSPVLRYSDSFPESTPSWNTMDAAWVVCADMCRYVQMLSIWETIGKPTLEISWNNRNVGRRRVLAPRTRCSALPSDFALCIGQESCLVQTSIGLKRLRAKAIWEARKHSEDPESTELFSCCKLSQALCLFVQDHSFEEAGQLASKKPRRSTGTPVRIRSGRSGNIKSISVIYWRLEFGSLVESEYIRHEHPRLIAFPTATRIQPSNVKSLNKEWSDRWVRSQISIKCNCAKEGELVQQKSKTLKLEEFHRRQDLASNYCFANGSLQVASSAFSSGEVVIADQTLFLVGLLSAGSCLCPNSTFGPIRPHKWLYRSQKLPTGTPWQSFQQPRSWNQLILRRKSPNKTLSLSSSHERRWQGLELPWGEKSSACNGPVDHPSAPCKGSKLEGSRGMESQRRECRLGLLHSLVVSSLVRSYLRALEVSWLIPWEKPGNLPAVSTGACSRVVSTQKWSCPSPCLSGRHCSQLAPQPHQQRT